jgi:hypothetical protein
MNYARIVNNQVVSYPFPPQSLRGLHPNISFPRVLTDALLAQYGIMQVLPVAKPTPRWFERVQELPPVNLSGVWTQQWEVIQIPDTERAAVTEAAREARLAALAQKRWEKETGGIVFNGSPVATDEVSQTKIIGAVVGSQLDPGVSMKWKMKNGQFVTLNAAQITDVAMAVRAHVQACFDREAELRMAIVAAGDAGTINAVDIDAGWPA